MFEFRYTPLIFGEIMGLWLSKVQGSNSFVDLFPKCLQILSWFLACKSITMTYRSSLSFVMLHEFFGKLRALDFVNFTVRTVFQTSFLNACRYSADFWHVSQSSWLKIKMEFRCISLIFCGITHLYLNLDQSKTLLSGNGLRCMPISQCI